MSAETNTPGQTAANADPALPPVDLSSRPSAASKELPIEPEMPGTSEKDASKTITLPYLPSDIKSLVQTADSGISRLNTLIKTPGGLQSFLSTSNYALYILSYAHMAAPSRARVIAKISELLGRPSTKIAPGAIAPTAPSTPLLPLALAISDLRTTLRLTGLIPLYCLLKSILANRNKAKDSITYYIQLTQCLGYIGFQLLENVYQLTAKTVLTTDFTNTRFARLGGQAKLVTWSCRSWMLGITCDFLRLAREAQLAQQPGSKYSTMSAEEKKTADAKWWSELMVATSWYPMAIQYSVEGGIGLSLGAIGCCGFFANVGNFLKLWATTKQ